MHFNENRYPLDLVLEYYCTEYLQSSNAENKILVLAKLASSEFRKEPTAPYLLFLLNTFVTFPHRPEDAKYEHGFATLFKLEEKRKSLLVTVISGLNEDSETIAHLQDWDNKMEKYSEWILIELGKQIILNRIRQTKDQYDVPVLIATINTLFPPNNNKSEATGVGLLTQHHSSPRTQLFQLVIDLEQRFNEQLNCKIENSLLYPVLFNVEWIYVQEHCKRYILSFLRFIKGFLPNSIQKVKDQMQQEGLECSFGMGDENELEL